MTSLLITVIAIVLFGIVITAAIMYIDSDEITAVGMAPAAASSLMNVVEASQQFRGARGHYPVSIADLESEFEIEARGLGDADFVISDGVVCLSMPYELEVNRMLEAAAVKIEGSVVTDVCGSSDVSGRRFLAYSLDGVSPPVAMAFVGTPGSPGGGGTPTPTYAFPSTVPFSQASALSDPNCGPAGSWEVLTGSGPAVYDDHCAASANNQFPIWEKAAPIPSQYADEVAAGVVSARLTMEMQGWSGDSDRGRLMIRCLAADGRQVGFQVTDYVDPTSWTPISVLMRMPAQCATLKMGAIGYRASGTENSIYFRNPSYELVGNDGGVQTISLASFRGDEIVGWTVEQGNLRLGSTYYYGWPTVKTESVTYGKGSKVIDVPESVLLAVDAGKAELALSVFAFNWGGQDDRGRISTIFVSEDGNETEGPASFPSLHAPTSLGGMYEQTVSMPARTRKVRFIYECTRVDGSNCDYNPASVHADLVLRR
ncbi:hypothetical protein [uncultured Salinicola sp.]|uniref:hypothetical protein n=1 Tax=uncultured Salinicola sp. TaxID=1193542 RepID=UPI002636D94F|nr:hypothetical protein [uncultured Salinicola sp.]